VDENEVDAMVQDTVLDLPEAWRTTDAGERMPEWEQIVRDSRSSH
jgi:hypothetical protein